MEPSQINAGRFYLRPLSDDDRIDDRPALRRALPNATIGDDAVEKARRDWSDNVAYSWACCEATCVDMAALIVLRPDGRGSGTLRASCVHDPDALIPNPEDLERVTYADAARLGAAAAVRWARVCADLDVSVGH